MWALGNWGSQMMSEAPGLVGHSSLMVSNGRNILEYIYVVWRALDKASLRLHGASFVRQENHWLLPAAIIQ